MSAPPAAVAVIASYRAVAVAVDNGGAQRQRLQAGRCDAGRPVVMLDTRWVEAR